MLKGKGLFVAVASNQSGVGRGYFTWEDLLNFTGRMLELIDWEVDVVVYCPCLGCGCRKPSPLMLEMVKSATGAKDCFMVGDQEADRLAGEAAGCRTVTVGMDERDLYQAALQVLEELRSAR
ncbi:hypothetical protein HS1genome_1894 [Sulfodiicoccus acidiphilus]|uniref:D,D-heptose 1,7-bisphosphate phosphatase n=1 Tax=Sulfodiicoccus acidiphilus TaxID=1670455 RepID=A0A348B5Q3_9CREN|nr:hypothetical protein HS1genome_1894 [Sulfodiicoccus acidiphilus]